MPTLDRQAHQTSSQPSGGNPSSGLLGMRQQDVRNGQREQCDTTDSMLMTFVVHSIAVTHSCGHLG